MVNATVTSNSVFGWLTVLRNVQRNDWLCRCECGVEVVVKGFKLLSGNNKSCGCLKRSVLGDATRTHGMANSRVKGYSSRAYGVWQAMRDRCSNPNRKDYYRYGGRGISVCERWARSFEAFLEDMGEPPAGLTLDRIDNDAGYFKENCKWATRKEQVLNSTQVKHIVLDGTTRPLSEWLQQHGLSKYTYYRRKRAGLTDEEALKKEKRSGNSK